MMNWNMNKCRDCGNELIEVGYTLTMWCENCRKHQAPLPTKEEVLDDLIAKNITQITVTAWKGRDIVNYEYYMGLRGCNGKVYHNDNIFIIVSHDSQWGFRGEDEPARKTIYRVTKEDFVP